MNTINSRKLGLATGGTGVIIYLGCILIMQLLGTAGTIQFFNNFLHGLDTTSIIRMDVPIQAAFFGIIQTFALGWVVGICIAGIYNYSIKKK